MAELGTHPTFEPTDTRKVEKKPVDPTNHEKAEIHKDPGGTCNEEDHSTMEIGVCRPGKKTFSILDEAEVP